MKKLTQLLVLLGSLGLGASANAALVHYTFTGTVTTVTDTAGIIGGSIVANVTPVEYVFAIDTAAAGTRTRYNGTTQTLVDGGIYNYYFVDYISGSLISGSAATHEEPLDYAEHNWGFTIGTTGYGSTELHTESVAEETWLLSTGLPDEWTLGKTAVVYERASNPSGAFSTIKSDLTLTSIAAAVVPIPAAVWLFGSALGLMGVMRRKISS